MTGRRIDGTNPRALGTNPRSTGNNPRAERDRKRAADAAARAVPRPACPACDDTGWEPGPGKTVIECRQCSWWRHGARS